MGRKKYGGVGVADISLSCKNEINPNKELRGSIPRFYAVAAKRFFCLSRFLKNTSADDKRTFSMY